MREPPIGEADIQSIGPNVVLASAGKLATPPGEGATSIASG